MFGKILAGVGALATGVAGFRASRGPKIPGDYRNALARAIQLEQAMRNPLTSPYAQAEREQVMADIARAVKGFRYEDDRMRRRTGQGLVSDRRRDEAATRGLMELFSKRGDFIQQRLARQLNANAATLGAMGPLFDASNAKFQGQLNTLSALGQGAFGLAPHADQFFGQQSQQRPLFGGGVTPPNNTFTNLLNFRDQGNRGGGPNIQRYR